MIFESLHKFNGKEEVPLSLTQIKQIAGRAGRFGMQRTTPDGASPDPLTPDETPAPGGSVTTLHKADLPILESLLPLPLPPITRATLDIPSSTLYALSSLLPPETTFAELLEHVSQLAILPPKTTLSANRHRTQLADVVEPLRGYLTLAEMETFSFAPVQQRDGLSVSVFEKVVTAFAHDGRVDLLECFNGTGLIKNLETVEEALKTLPPLPTSENGLPDRKVFTPPILVAGIPLLETLHKSLVMYIWLSYRYDVSFPDRPLAVEIKTRTEVVLDQCLARLPGMKSKKNSSQARGPVDRRSIRFADGKKDRAPMAKAKEKVEVKWDSKGQDQQRRKSEIWKNVGMVGGGE
jgi:ATP-dependent RNA helicase SUPV3L1/SUV3